MVSFEGNILYVSNQNLELMVNPQQIQMTTTATTRKISSYFTLASMAMMVTSNSQKGLNVTPSSQEAQVYLQQPNGSSVELWVGVGGLNCVIWT